MLHDTLFGFERPLIYHEDLGHADLDPGNDITSYFYLLFLSHVFFLFNVLSLSLDTCFKCLVCNFPLKLHNHNISVLQVSSALLLGERHSHFVYTITLAERLPHCPL